MQMVRESQQMNDDAINQVATALNWIFQFMTFSQELLPEYPGVVRMAL
jgi:hypothetical protein